MLHIPYKTKWHFFTLFISPFLADCLPFQGNSQRQQSTLLTLGHSYSLARQLVQIGIEIAFLYNPTRCA